MVVSEEGHSSHIFLQSLNCFVEVVGGACTHCAKFEAKPQEATRTCGHWMVQAQIVAGHSSCPGHIVDRLKVQDIPFYIFPSREVAIYAVAIGVLELIFVFFNLSFSSQEVLESESGLPA